MEIKKFIKELKENKKYNAKYDAGWVYEYDDRFIIDRAQAGAEESFSIGQPVYDEEGNVMGFLGVTLFRNLNYAKIKGIDIPVECWEICLPTKHCKNYKKVYTYWKNEERKIKNG